MSDTPAASTPLRDAEGYCDRCRGAKEPGWLCVDHGLPWEHDGCGAEAGPCVCNPHGLVQWREVFAAARGDDEPKH